MIINSIGIIGYGNFGQFLTVLAGRFASEVEIKVYSRRHSPDNELFFTQAEVAACDVMVLACSINEYEQQLQVILPLLGPDTILVDVATVKNYPSSIFKKYAGHQPWISLHPMFGPESYKKHREDVSGFRIVVTDYTLPNDAYLVLRNLFSGVGFVVIEMSSQEHDKLLAETLFLTHYVGQTMQAGGFGRTNIDTVSFSYLMDAVESVVNDKRLFEDVYRFNPYCREVAERFHKAQELVLESLPDHE